MKKTRKFRPVRAEQKPSVRWLSRPSVERELWRRFAEQAAADVQVVREQPCPEEERRYAINDTGKPVEFRSGAKPEGFAVTKDLEIVSLSASMTGRRLVAVVLFGPDDLPTAESIIRSRIAPNKDDRALRDCLQAAVRRCRESRRSQDEQP
ncbi:hypothetical protein I6G56_26690 [Burkholderia humptydooensis]|uniref:Uncharacterized protein n=1 Tax=Burkholderia humptydooensis TaxID=430531 RepID=A0A7T2X0E1_9BURK|nr:MULTISPECIES: hypothetical protein [Burkholderia]QPS45733.1 hypothetical protein I6G56_26690 [Burkholderia humptydooensis]